MRTITLLAWLMLPVLMAAYHYGPGQRQLQLDKTDRYVLAAEDAAISGLWEEATVNYKAALSNLPAKHVAVDRRLRLELCKAQMHCQKLSTAHGDLKILVTELTSDPDADPELVADARSTLANSQYYMTWLMRLEGQPKSRWEPEIQAARQTYRMLAETSATGDDKNRAVVYQEDLESAILLARMDIKDLQGLPLPNQ